VQVGSFTEIENAEALRDELQAAGFAAFEERALSAGERVFRVLVGPEKDLRGAGALQTRLRLQEGLEGIVVSRYPSTPESRMPRRLDW
jgi:cell division septation protein DedD